MGFHLILAVIVTVVIVFMVAFLLKKYTHHGVEVTLPDYVGQNADALMNSDTTDFIFVVRNTVFDKNKPANADKLPIPLLVCIKYRGSVSDVTAAVQAGIEVAEKRTGVVQHYIIPSPEEGTRKMLKISAFDKR